MMVSFVETEPPIIVKDDDDQRKIFPGHHQLSHTYNKILPTDRCKDKAQETLGVTATTITSHHANCNTQEKFEL